MLFEPTTTINTGDLENERTRKFRIYIDEATNLSNRCF